MFQKLLKFGHYLDVGSYNCHRAVAIVYAKYLRNFETNIRRLPLSKISPDSP